MELILLFVLCLFLGASTAFLAAQRGRDPFLWSMGILILSMIDLPFAIIALGVLYFLPTKEESAADKDAAEVIEIKPLSSTPEEFLLVDWYFYDQQKICHGPVSFDKLYSAWEEGQIQKETYVWRSGWESWKRLEELPEVLKALEKDS